MQSSSFTPRRDAPAAPPGAALLVLLALGATAACDAPERASADVRVKAYSTPVAKGVDGRLRPRVADFPQIQWRGKLRVLLPGLDTQAGYAANAASSHAYELELVEEFAEKHYLDLDLVHVDRWEELIPELLRGRGDLVAANLTITDRRKNHVAFTVPIDTLREQLVVRRGDEIASAEDLVGREVAVRAPSSFWELLKRLRKTHPEIDVRLLPEHTPANAMLEAVATGRYDMAAVDTSELQTLADDWPDLKISDAFAQDSVIAWGVHPKSEKLLTALNNFLNKEQLKRRSRLLYKEDFPGIKKRKVLRVLTRNNATSYFVWRGQQLGFEYELMRKFAESHGLHLEMVVPKAWDDLIPTLLAGGGDLIAASLTINEERKRKGLAFSDPYNYVSEVLVSRVDDKEFTSPEDLQGRTVVVRPTSSYWNTLEQIQARGIDFKLELAPEHMETEEIIARVASGEYDLTVSDSHILNVELVWRDDVKAALTLKGPVPHGWAVRAGDEKLRKALNAFLEKEHRGLFYNVVYNKYFENPRRVRRHVAARLQRTAAGRLSPYDELVRKYADEYGFDWQLIVAQMYQESRFDPKAESWAGARGLMQVLPATAKRFGISNLYDVKASIEAGVRYLAWLHERFEPELSVRDRMWFALASYNAGLGHVRDARRLASKLGLDPNRWFDNVERAMLLLSRRSFYLNAEHGYVRGREPVEYVREIRDRYDAYISWKRAS